MTTNSTHWCNRMQESRGGNTNSRLPPRTRPFVVLPPNKAFAHRSQHSHEFPCDCNECSHLDIACEKYERDTDAERAKVHYSTKRHCNGEFNEINPKVYSNNSQAERNLLPSRLLIGNSHDRNQKREASPGRILCEQNQNYLRLKSNSIPSLQHCRSVDDERSSRLGGYRQKTNEDFLASSDSNNLMQRSKLTHSSVPYEPNSYRTTSKHWHGSSPAVVERKVDKTSRDNNCQCWDSDRSRHSNKHSNLYRCNSCDNSRVFSNNTALSDRARHSTWTSCSSLQHIPQRLHEDPRSESDRPCLNVAGDREVQGRVSRQGKDKENREFSNSQNIGHQTPFVSNNLQGMLEIETGILCYFAQTLTLEYVMFF